MLTRSVTSLEPESPMHVRVDPTERQTPARWCRLGGMSERSPRRRAVALPSPLWVVVSVVLHVLFVLTLRDPPADDEFSRFQLPNQIAFGIADVPQGGGSSAPAPPPAKKAETKSPKAHKLKPPRDPNAYAKVVDKQAADAKAEADKATTAQGKERGEDAANSGEGDALGAIGDGTGMGFGDGNGYAPAGATLALNVDLERVRKSALLLETQALLDIVPEWQSLLAGSGLDPVQDFQRVFVATPNLERSSLVVSALHTLPRARIDSAVAALAAERGEPAAFHQEDGYAVAPWRNRGPTERVIALTSRDQLTITRTTDLARVLGVARSLAQLRSQQGFDQKELAQQGGLLAMQAKEAVALWVEDLHKYVRGDVDGVPSAVRLSVYHVDQFNTELRVRGQYESPAAAANALTAMDALRQQLSNHPRVIYLGLKSAMDSAVIEQQGSALALHVRLTLHQTRYLMRYVSHALRPKSAS
ncbi:MAG TPA: hypothetical protein VHZ95_09955 [Polyangiales bacterium]|nr:hypothetical protein [Polyangiales bacterium]